jgi:anaphase-promoting complex subunit 1
VIEKIAPCVLPELDNVRTVIINDPNYWPITFERGRNWDQLTNILKANGCIDIVQKAGCLSHLDDPNRLKSLLAQTLTTEKYSTWKIDPLNLMSFYNNRMMINFTKMVMGSKRDENISPIRDIILLQIYDCLSRDKTHAFGIYISYDNVRKLFYYCFML